MAHDWTPPEAEFITSARDFPEIHILGDGRSAEVLVIISAPDRTCLCVSGTPRFYAWVRAHRAQAEKIADTFCTALRNSILHEAAKGNPQ